MTIPRVGSVERILHWTFGDECVAAFDEETLAMSATPDSLVALASAVDRTAPGARAAARDHHDDALTVARVARECALNWHDYLDLRQFAIARTRPPLRPDTRLRFEPRLGFRGGWYGRRGRTETVRFYDETVRGRRVRRKVDWTPITPINDPEEIAWERAQYVYWWGYLDLIRVALSHEKLTAWRVTPQMPIREPWLTNELKFDTEPAAELRLEKSRAVSG